MLSIPDRLRDGVNKEKWGKRFDIEDTENHDQEAVDTYILYREEWYRFRGYDDYRLWDYFREDFEGWTPDLFALGGTDTVRDFRDYLREYGVFIPKNGERISKNLCQVINEEKWHEWTTEEVENQLATKKFFSFWNPNSREHDRQRPVPQRPISPQVTSPDTNNQTIQTTTVI